MGAWVAKWVGDSLRAVHTRLLTHSPFRQFKPLAPWDYLIQRRMETPRSMAALAIIEASSPQSGNGDSDVARAAAGDRGAFEKLYRRHVNRVFSLCARMVNDRERAEELTQDVFVRAWDKLHLFRGESSFSTWLHRLTVNVVLNARKSEGRQRSRFEENDEEDGGMEELQGVVGMK